MITQNELKEELEYNPLNGEFKWLHGKRGLRKGSIAGYLSPESGYIHVRLNKVLYRAHRLAWFYMTGEWSDDCMDHINHNRSDNRIDNLRCVSRSINQSNLSMNINNTSGITGVMWNKALNKWHAQITTGGVKKHLGYHLDIKDAIESRQHAERMYGFHANHGKDI